MFQITQLLFLPLDDAAAYFKVPASAFFQTNQNPKETLAKKKSLLKENNIIFPTTYTHPMAPSEMSLFSFGKG
jgi:hypothetical protein